MKAKLNRHDVRGTLQQANEIWKESVDLENRQEITGLSTATPSVT